VADTVAEDTKAGMPEVMGVMPLWDMRGLRVAEVTPLRDMLALRVAEVYTAASQVVAARELGNAVLRGRALSAAAAALVATTAMAIPTVRTAIHIPITAQATAIRMAAIMVTDPVGAMIHITDIVPADNILTDTGTRLIWASALAAIKLNQHH